MMLWTQGAWAHGDSLAAAYLCTNGHVLDPATTRECPGCGVHDTRLEHQFANKIARACNQCGTRFMTPR
jgi:hypothetical protein